MPDTIKDGKGRGYLAEVTKENLLETNAVTETTYAWISRTKQRAFVLTSGAITTDGTANDVFIMTNPSSDYEIHIVQIDISCTTTATTNINVNQTYSSGGTGLTATNLNRKSGIPSTVTATDVYYGDDMTLTGTGLVYATFVHPANEPFREEIGNSIILGAQDSLSVNINAASGTAYVSVKYYEVEV